jgi:glycosylphosphatidylinositol transamidase (GPIT) subunit GPI8
MNEDKLNVYKNWTDPHKPFQKDFLKFSDIKTIIREDLRTSKRFLADKWKSHVMEMVEDLHAVENSTAIASIIWRPNIC